MIIHASLAGGMLTRSLTLGRNNIVQVDEKKLLPLEEELAKETMKHFAGTLH